MYCPGQTGDGSSQSGTEEESTTEVGLGARTTHIADWMDERRRETFIGI